MTRTAKDMPRSASCCLRPSTISFQTVTVSEETTAGNPGGCQNTENGLPKPTPKNKNYKRLPSRCRHTVGPPQSPSWLFSQTKPPGSSAKPTRSASATSGAAPAQLHVWQVQSLHGVHEELQIRAPPVEGRRVGWITAW